MYTMLSAKEDSLCELDREMEEHTLLEDMEVEIELVEKNRDNIIGMKRQTHRMLRGQETVSDYNPLAYHRSDASTNSARSP